MTAQPKFSLIVGYGTDMGNAEDAAMSFAEAVQEAMGIESEAVELNQVEIADLQSASHFIVVTSTFGDGEFPDSAALFWEAISAESADRLDHLKFAVLALGDSSYELFCNAGRLLDERLQALGAVRLTARVDVTAPTSNSRRRGRATWSSCWPPTALMRDRVSRRLPRRQRPLLPRRAGITINVSRHR